jgi:ribosomal protein L16 Arg81 hydroxylase
MHLDMNVNQFENRLEHLIGSDNKDEFLMEYWEKNYFHTNAYSLENIKFNMHDLEDILSCSRLTSNDLRLSSVEQNVPSFQYCDKNGIVNIQQAFFYFNRGSTIVIRSVEDFSPQLQKLCFDLKAEFGNIKRIFINLYLTPENSQGFFHHYDREDVFILQIDGAKEWYLYDSPLLLPLEDQAFSIDNIVPDRKRLKKLLLKPGSSLYIPRGLIHEAKSQSGISCHLTISLVPFTWYDVVKNYYKELSHTNVLLRKSIPKAVKEKEVINHLNGINEMNPEILRRVVNQMKASYDSQLLNRFEVQGSLTGHRTLTDQSISVSLNESLYKGFSITDQTIELAVGLITVFLPLESKSIIEYMISNKKCKVKDIPSDYRKKDKMIIINRLIQDSFLQIEEK